MTPAWTPAPPRSVPMAQDPSPAAGGEGVACAHEDLEAMFQALLATGLPRLEAAVELAGVAPDGIGPFLWDEVRAVPGIDELEGICDEIAERNPEAANWAFGAWLTQASADSKREGWRSWLGLYTQLPGVQTFGLTGKSWLRSLPEGVGFKGHLNLEACDGFTTLPAGLKVEGDCRIRNSQNLTGLPGGMVIDGDLDFSYCVNLKGLPGDLKVGEGLHLDGCASLTDLPVGLAVPGFLGLSCCTGLRSLPDGLRAGAIFLNGCTGLLVLPKGMRVGGRLDATGCAGLVGLSADLEVAGDLDLTRCRSLQSLPDGLTVRQNLLLYDCSALERLPAGLRVGTDLDLVGCDAWDGRIPEDAKVNDLVYTPRHLDGIPLAAWRKLHPHGERP